MTAPLFEAPDGCHYESPAEYLWIGVLGGCGCGAAETAAALALEVLEYFGLDFPARAAGPAFTFDRELVAHWLDSLDLIEHGGSIGGSWLTEKGKQLLAVLEAGKAAAS